MTAFFSRLLTRRRFLAHTAMTAGVTLGGSTFLQACGSSPISSPNNVELTILAPGSEPTGWTSVLAAVNKKLASDNMGISLRIQWISWANYVNDILLKMTAGAKFDAVLTATWAHLNDFLSSKAIRPLDSYVSKLPNLQKVIPPLLWNANTFNGQIMAVPLGSSLASFSTYVVRKDLRLKYGLPELKTYADMENFLYIVEAHEQKIIPWAMQKYNQVGYFNTTPWKNQPGTTFGIGSANAIVDISDPANPKVLPYWETPGYLDSVERAHRYLHDGIYTQDLLNITGDDSYNLFKQGKFAVAPCVTDGLTTAHFGDVIKNVPGAELEIVVPFEIANPKPLNSFQMWNFLAIPTRSLNAERVMHLMDWLSIQENHDLLEYGLPGKDWQAIGSRAVHILLLSYVISLRIPWVHGGQDPQIIIQQSDIDNVVRPLVSLLTADAQEKLRKQINNNERVVNGSLQCLPMINMDHKAGDQAASVTVVVSVKCTEKVF